MVARTIKVNEEEYKFLNKLKIDNKLKTLSDAISILIKNKKTKNINTDDDINEHGY